MNKKVMGAIIGLVKTAENNPKTSNTDMLIKQALSDCDNEAWVEVLHKEKYTISPGCQICKSPCGNTDDYDLEQMGDDIKEIKKELMAFAIAHVQEEQTFSFILQILSFVGYDLEPRYFDNILKKVREYA
ncbi:MAG: hypothetical protein Q4C49_14105 [Bacillota bacterium]|nr:hypothetical protein [Bacillota bacterium]